MVSGLNEEQVEFRVKLLFLKTLYSFNRQPWQGVMNNYTQLVVKESMKPQSRSQRKAR